MVEPMRRRALKFRKKMKEDDTPAKIEKKPLDPTERRKKWRSDMLKVARRYEKMRLYDDAITYYKKIGLRDDVDRLVSIKEEQYVTKAKEFEGAGKLEDALRLYENLKMTVEVERINRLLGKESVIDKKPPTKLPKFSEELETTEIATESEDEQIELVEYEEGEEEFKELTEDDQEPPNKLDYIGPTRPESATPAKPAESKMKIFKICPYCGEELNLPKKPNFCPYCKESYV
jgi:tetratricopeptide (TPR) repeat protein